MMRNGRIIWEEILEPILRENKGWAIFIFTPKGRNFAYEYYLKAKADKSGDWTHSILPASVSGLIDSDELLKARESMPQRLFAQEFECDFLEDASSVFHGVDSIVAGGQEAPKPGHANLRFRVLQAVNRRSLDERAARSVGAAISWRLDPQGRQSTPASGEGYPLPIRGVSGA